MPVQPDRKLLARTQPSQGDHLVSHFDPWRAFNIGTTTASITVPCPANAVGSRRAQIAICTLYATSVGAGGKVVIRSGNDVIMEYKLTDSRPLQLNFFPGNLTIEPTENLTIEVTGATSAASISATGVIYR
jgi:hypothetical protein